MFPLDRLYDPPEDESQPARGGMTFNTKHGEPQIPTKEQPRHRQHSGTPISAHPSSNHDTSKVTTELGQKQIMDAPHKLPLIMCKEKQVSSIDPVIMTSIPSQPVSKTFGSSTYGLKRHFDSSSKEGEPARKRRKVESRAPAPMSASIIKPSAVDQLTEVAVASGTHTFIPFRSSRNEPILDPEGHDISRFRPNLPILLPKLCYFLGCTNDAGCHREQTKKDQRQHQNKKEVHKLDAIQYDKENLAGTTSKLAAMVSTDFVADLSSQQALSLVDTALETPGVPSHSSDTAMEVDDTMGVNPNPPVPVYYTEPRLIQLSSTPPAIPTITLTNPTPPPLASTFAFELLPQRQVNPTIPPSM